MRMNRLHGTVADRPIDAQVVQTPVQRVQNSADQGDSAIDRINSIIFGPGNSANDVYLKSMPRYGKGKQS
jgi:hypothetical protein